MARTNYQGRHRFGHPGLVYCRELMTRAGQRKPKRWFGWRISPAKHGATVIPMPMPASSQYSPATRAA